MAEADRQQFIGFLDQPGPVAVAGSKISVRGWVAGPGLIGEVSLLINGVAVGIAPEREARDDLKKLSYPEANVFGFRFPDLSPPDVVDSDATVAIEAKSTNGQTFRSAKTLRIVDTVKDALLFLDERPDEPVSSYVHLAFDLFESGRRYGTQQVIDSAKKRFPNDAILEEVTSPAGALHTFSHAEFPSDLFDHRWYTYAYPELRLRETRSECVRHYLLFGSWERRDPNPLFDSKWYAQNYNLPADADPLLHYAHHEKAGQVGPNAYWDHVRASSIIQPPPLSKLLVHYPRVRKPAFINDIGPAGRTYLNGLILNSGLDIAYYLRFSDPGTRGAPYSGAVPVIFTGHTTAIYEGHYKSNFGRALLDLAAGHLINLVFLYRHPLDSFVSNWAFEHNLSLGKKAELGISDLYESIEDFYRDLNDNIYEFSLFCGGSKDFIRITQGPAVRTAGGTAGLSLLEFIHETEAFISNPNVHCFRFEDFVSDPAAEFKRFVSIVAPDLTPKFDNVPLPRAVSSRYQSAKENVSSFRALISSLPTEITKRIEAMGYSM